VPDDLTVNANGDTTSDLVWSPTCSAFASGLYRLRYVIGRAGAHLGYREAVGEILRSLGNAKLLLPNPDNPTPKARFGPPLPQNATSLSEYCDVELGNCSRDAIETSIQSLPEGLAIAGGERIDVRTEALSAWVWSAKYLLSFPSAVRSAGDIGAYLELFQEQPQWLIQTPTPKGDQRERDLRQGVVSWEVRETAGETRLSVVLALRHEQGHTASPALLLKELFELDTEDASLVGVQRLEMYDQHETPASKATWRRQRNRLLHTRCWESLRFRPG
jgi:radical SAM-linked protein